MAAENRLAAELYRRYRIRVYRTALAVLKSPALAEEAAQEVWLRAVAWRGQGEDLERQLPVMAKNAAIDLLRRESRSGPLPESWEPPAGTTRRTGPPPWRCGSSCGPCPRSIGTFWS